MSDDITHDVAADLPSHWFEQHFGDNGISQQCENDRKLQKDTQFIFCICADPNCSARRHFIEHSLIPYHVPHKFCSKNKHTILTMCRICRKPLTVPPNYKKSRGEYFLYHRRNHCVFSQQSSSSLKVLLQPPVSSKDSMDTRGYAIIHQVLDKKHISVLLTYAKTQAKKRNFTAIFNEDINVFVDSSSLPPPSKPLRLQLHLNETKTVVAVRDSIKSVLIAHGILTDEYNLFQPVIIQSKKGCPQQAYHMDTGRHTQSFGILVAISDSSLLWVVDNNSLIDIHKPTKLTIAKGDIIVFHGSTVHAGAAYDSENFRLHFYASRDQTQEDFTFRPNSLLLRHLKALDEKKAQNALAASNLKKRRMLLKQQQQQQLQQQQQQQQ